MSFLKGKSSQKSQKQYNSKLRRQNTSSNLRKAAINNLNRSSGANHLTSPSSLRRLGPTYLFTGAKHLSYKAYTSQKIHKVLWKRYFISPENLLRGTKQNMVDQRPYRSQRAGARTPYFFTFSKKLITTSLKPSKFNSPTPTSLWVSFTQGTKDVTLSNSESFLFVERVKNALSPQLTSKVVETPFYKNTWLVNKANHADSRQDCLALLSHSFSLSTNTCVVSSPNFYLDNTITTSGLKKLLSVRDVLSLHKGLSYLNIFRKKNCKHYFSLYSYVVPADVVNSKSILTRTYIPELRAATKGFYLTQTSTFHVNTSLASPSHTLGLGLTSIQKTNPLSYPLLALTPANKEVRVVSSITKLWKPQRTPLSTGVLSVTKKKKYNVASSLSSVATLKVSAKILKKSSLKSRLLVRRLSKGKRLIQKTYRRFRYLIRRRMRRERILSRKFKRFFVKRTVRGRQRYRSFALRPNVRFLLRKKVRRFKPALAKRANKLLGLVVPPKFKSVVAEYRKTREKADLLIAHTRYAAVKYLNLPVSLTQYDSFTSLSANVLPSQNVSNVTSSTFDQKFSLNSLLNSLPTETLFSLWSNPTLLKASSLDYLTSLPYSNSTNLPSQNVKWVLKLQNQLLSYLFGPNLNSVRKLNLWSVPNTSYSIRRKLLRRALSGSFRADVATWYHSSLTRFIESCTGRKVALNFGPFVEGALTFEDHALLSLWGPRTVGFQRMLGHKIFAREALMLIALSLRLKDPTFLANWIRGMLKRMSFWKYRVLFRYIKFLMRHLFFFSFQEFGFRGFKLRLKGKISVAGNARTRTLVLQVGNTSHSKMDNKVAYDLSYVNTFTGVLGFKLWFFY